jgi:histidinol-phosphatase
MYGALLETIAKEADAIAMRYFRTGELRIDRKGDGTAVTQADRAVEEMARAKVAASGLPLDVLGEDMGGIDSKAASNSGRALMIIDPIDGTEEFSRGIPTFGTLMGIESKGEIVAGFASAPALGTRWWAYRSEGAYRDERRLRVSEVPSLSKAMVFTTERAPAKRRGPNGIRRLLDAAETRDRSGDSGIHAENRGAIEAALDWTSKPWDWLWESSWKRRAGARRISAARKFIQAAPTERQIHKC